MPKTSRMIFMGTPMFAVPSLQALIEAGHEVLAVVTQPDKPKGRGMETVASPVKLTALSHNIPVFEPPKVRDVGFIEKIRSLNPEFIVVVAYGKILPEAILKIPVKGCVNLHASLLPKYRGAAPINWAIINGEKETGNTTMLMDIGMDTGPMLLKESLPIEEADTAESLTKKLSVSGARLLAKTIELMLLGKIMPEAQDEKEATCAPILRKEHGKIDWSKSAGEIKSLMRGVYPWPGAYTSWQGKLLKIHDGRALSPDNPDGFQPGTVTGVTKEGIMIKCGGGTFEVLELQPENKKRMSAADFQKGYRVGKGERFE